MPTLHHNNEVEDNDKDDNNYKDISALGLDRDMGFSRGHQGIDLLMMMMMRRRRMTTWWRTMTRTTTTTRISQLWG